MKITKEEVYHVANLARLALDQKKVSTYAAQAADILNYVDILNQVDTTGIQPTSHAISLTNAFRIDDSATGLSVEKAIANAPEKQDGAFIVPKIIGDPS